MNKITKLIALAIMTITMLGCGAIDTNNAGVRTSWDKQVKPEIVGAGFYTAVISGVDEWVGKEKELEAKRKEVDIKAQEALANDELAASLGPQIMRLRELDAMVEACQNNTCIIDFTNGTGVKPLINMPARR